MTTGSLLPIGLVPVVVLVIGVTACVTDVRSRKIPNILTFGAAACGVLFHVMVHGSAGLLLSAGGWATGVLLFLPFFLLRGMGAGDVKLLAALGSWLGPLQTLWLALFASMAGGVLALAVACPAAICAKCFKTSAACSCSGTSPDRNQYLSRRWIAARLRGSRMQFRFLSGR